MSASDKKFRVWYVDVDLVIHYKNFETLAQAKKFISNKRNNGLESGLMK